MIKRAFAVILFLAIFFAVTVVYASEINVEVDGIRLNFSDQGPELVDGRTLVPVRDVFEALGFIVEWEEATQTAVLSRGTDTLRITIGESTFIRNSEGLLLDVPARIIGGRTMLPLRLPLESVGFEVGWDTGRSAVIVSTAGDISTAETSTSEISMAETPTTETSTAENAAEIFESAPEIVGIHGMLTRVVYGDNVAYILGSMHAGKPYWFPLAQIAEEAMARSDVFAFEYNIAAGRGLSWESSYNEMFALYRTLRIPDNRTLREIMPSDAFFSFQRNLRTYSSRGISYDMVKNLTPLAVIEIIYASMPSALGDVSRDFSVDDYIVDFALANNKPIIGLNSMLREFEIISDIPLEIQVNALNDFPDYATLLEMIIEESRNIRLDELYETQNIDAIREFLIASAAASEGNPFLEIYQRNLMYVRDNVFAEEIARLLRETREPTTFFMTIGLAHIIDGYGIVLDLLEEMGFELTSLWNQ